jgi:hypothetical protein
MISGVYELSFPNGSRYIGKSMDIHRRWTEHRNSFNKGKAAKKMQECFDRYGFPDGTILYECHSDHVDLMEAYFIIKNTPSLNTSIPIRLNPDEMRILGESTLLHLSTSQQLQYAHSMQELATAYEEVIVEKNGTIEELQYVRTSEELRTELGAKLYDVTEALDNLKDDHEEMTEAYLKLKAYCDKPWYTKIF